MDDLVPIAWHHVFFFGPYRIYISENINIRLAKATRHATNGWGQLQLVKYLYLIGYLLRPNWEATRVLIRSNALKVTKNKIDIAVFLGD